MTLKPARAHAGDEDDELARKFKQSHKAARKTWALPDSFPNHVVVNAYVSPTVDTSREKCAACWPHPAMLLAHLMHQSISWSSKC